MPVPFEALLPYGLIIALFGVTGAGLSKVRHWSNGGKRPRYGLDTWDRYDQIERRPRHIDKNDADVLDRIVMNRDRRLTGELRGQTDAPDAPPGFEYNNPWACEKRII